MSAQILSGREVAKQIKEELRRRVQILKQNGVEPGLAAILVGEHPSSVVYVGLKEKDCASVGIRSLILRLPQDCSQSDLHAAIRDCNEDPAVHGLLLQHPLPSHLDEDVAIRAIAPEKDIDGVTPAAFGDLVVGAPRHVSPTALGALALAKQSGIDLTGKRAVVVGRSKIVGRPAAWLLLQENATVTICHSRTVDLPGVTRQAEVLVVAIDRPEFIRRDHIMPGAVVVDCGYNRLSDRQGDVGDVDFAGVSEVAGWISPVPGGVGPAGRAMLIANCVRAAEMQPD